MRLFDPYETDPDRPACHCEECLGQFAQTYFAPQRMLGRQLLDYSAY